MGTITTGFHPGLRRLVFVGYTADYQPVIDYLAPGFKDVPGMMDGLRAVAQRTVGQHAVLRAAALSFGLVYIHPLADGNGRISRFLINDTLRRDGGDSGARHLAGFGRHQRVGPAPACVRPGAGSVLQTLDARGRQGLQSCARCSV